MSRTVPVFIAAVVAGLLLTSCMQVSNHDDAKSKDPDVSAAPSHRLVVRSYIDGSDFLRIRGSRVWFEHRDWDRPGLAGDQNRPTLLNGIPWWPTWSTATQSRPADADVELSTEVATKVTVKPVRARGTVQVVESPAKANDFTAKILLDDDAILGAAWYEVAIEWE